MSASPEEMILGMIFLLFFLSEKMIDPHHFRQTNVIYRGGVNITFGLLKEIFFAAIWGGKFAFGLTISFTLLGLDSSSPPFFWKYNLLNLIYLYNQNCGFDKSNPYNKSRPLYYMIKMYA